MLLHDHVMGFHILDHRSEQCLDPEVALCLPANGGKVSTVNTLPCKAATSHIVLVYVLLLIRTLFGALLAPGNRCLTCLTRVRILACMVLGYAFPM